MLDFGVFAVRKMGRLRCKAWSRNAPSKAISMDKVGGSYVITDSFKKRAGAVSDYFAKRIFPGPVMNAT